MSGHMGTSKSITETQIGRLSEKVAGSLSLSRTRLASSNLV